jgi:hypothetical protein
MQPFSPEVIEQAREVNLVDFLQSCGVPLIKEGIEYRLKEHDSLVINSETNLWKWNSRGFGGKNAIDYLERVENKGFIEAISILVEKKSYLPVHNYSEPSKKVKKPFSLPPPADNTRRVFAYLCKERCVSPAIVNHFIKAYDLYEDAEHHNAVFVGRDENGIPRFANKRSTNTLIPKFDAEGKKINNRWDVEGSDKAIAFKHIGQSETLYIFEAAIDMLSYISIRLLKEQNTRWKKDSYIALGGKADLAIMEVLKRNPSISTMIFCLDNDFDGKRQDGTPANWGQISADRYIEIFSEAGYSVSKEIPEYGKDFNDTLKHIVRGEG